MLGLEVPVIEKYLQYILEDLTDFDGAAWELAYRAYEINSIGNEVCSSAYEVLGREIRHLLKEAGAYTGNILQFQFQRMLANDIVLVRIDCKE